MCVIYTSKGMSKKFGCALSIEKYGISFSSLPSAPQPSQNAQLNAGFQCDATNLYFCTIKCEESIYILCTIVFTAELKKNKHKIHTTPLNSHFISN
jgi:hypothetical protein